MRYMEFLASLHLAVEKQAEETVNTADILRGLKKRWIKVLLWLAEYPRHLLHHRPLSLLSHSIHKAIHPLLSSSLTVLALLLR